MNKLHLLFIKDGLQYQIKKGKSVIEESIFFIDEENPQATILQKLNSILDEKSYGEIVVVSAINHFTMMPEGFSQHEIGYDLIGYNAPVDQENEELMLSVNKKFKVQFYYTFPKNL